MANAPKIRMAVASLALSASALVGIAIHEGYVGETYKDIVGVPTIGFGETQGVRLGDRTDPVRALIQLNKTTSEFSKRVAACITVPVSQNEFDAYVSFAYNVGTGGFCSSTLVKKLNANDYDGACSELLKWVYAGGKPVQGLVNRRQKEYQQCIGN
jgi:lysozyme